MSDDELDWQKNVKPINCEKVALKINHKVNIRFMSDKVSLREKFLNIDNVGLSFYLDYNTKLKVNKGRYSISGKLDLHGYSIDNAYYKLINFIIKNYQIGNRCLLIVTGNAADKTDTIKSNFSKWLSDTEIQHMVLYHQQATKHGGKGAFYVLLRRNRGLRP
ncbi:MAG: Smr/MutS family protein [Wolbachia sp.]